MYKRHLKTDTPMCEAQRMSIVNKPPLPSSEAPDCHEQVQDYLERMRKWRDDKPVLADPSQRGPLPKGG